MMPFGNSDEVKALEAPPTPRHPPANRSGLPSPRSDSQPQTGERFGRPVGEGPRSSLPAPPGSLALQEPAEGSRLPSGVERAGDQAFRYTTRTPEERAKYGAAIFSGTAEGATPEGFDQSPVVNTVPSTFFTGRGPTPQSLTSARQAAMERGDLAAVENSYKGTDELNALNQRRVLERAASTTPYGSQSLTSYMQAAAQGRNARRDLKALDERKAASATAAREQDNFNRELEQKYFDSTLDYLKDSSAKLTQAQEANNSEIDAARASIAGLSREEILRRTQEATATGRDNPDFDPYLAALVKRATQRKVGEDADFENLHRRFFGGEPGQDTKAKLPGEADPADTPPYPGAQRAPDGNWYVRQGDQWFQVEID